MGLHAAFDNGDWWIKIPIQARNAPKGWTMIFTCSLPALFGHSVVRMCSCKMFWACLIVSSYKQSAVSANHSQHHIRASCYKGACIFPPTETRFALRGWMLESRRLPFLSCGVLIKLALKGKSRLRFSLFLNKLPTIVSIANRWWLTAVALVARCILPTTTAYCLLGVFFWIRCMSRIRRLLSLLIFSIFPSC